MIDDPGSGRFCNYLKIYGDILSMPHNGKWKEYYGIIEIISIGTEYINV